MGVYGIESFPRPGNWEKLPKGSDICPRKDG